KGGERSRSLQQDQAKSSKSKIVRFEPDGALQGRKRYSQDAFVVSSSLASTVDQLAQLPQHKPVSGNIHVEPQRFCFCEQCPHDRQPAIPPAELGGSNVETALIRFQEKEFDNGGLVLERNPELSSRQPSTGVKAQGPLQKGADFNVALKQAPLERRDLEKLVLRFLIQRAIKRKNEVILLLNKGE